MTPEEAKLPQMPIETALKWGHHLGQVSSVVTEQACISLTVEVERLQKAYTQSTALLQMCYQCGHREGWEDGPTTNETLRQVNDYLCAQIPGWGEQKRSPRELLRMPKEKRSRILRTAAAKAESDYRRNRDLTDYEANGSE